MFKTIAITLICVGVFCLTLAFVLCLCKTAKNADEQYEKMYYEKMYEEGIYNDKHQRK